MIEATGQLSSTLNVEYCYVMGTTRVQGPDYTITVREGEPHVNLTRNGEQLLGLLAGSIHTAETPDELTGMGRTECIRREDAVVIRRDIESSAWTRKTLVVECLTEGVDIHYELVAPKGQPRHLDTCDYFGGNYATYNESGYFPSGTRFEKVFNPNPTWAENPIHPISQPSVIGVTGYARPGKDHWFASPAPYCYGFNKDGSWLMAGLKTPLEMQTFTSYQYDGFAGAFTLRLEYERQTVVTDTFHTPTIALRFATGPYEGLGAYCQEVRKSSTPGPAPTTNHHQAEWWKRPIFCGWGAQVELADEQGESAQSYCRQDIYDDFISILDANGVHTGTVTIDDKWQTHYGTNVVDTEKWPDLAGWIQQRHLAGQKVLLWLKAWDPESIPAEWCVRTQKGHKVSVDPSHPRFQEALRGQVGVMLGTEGYNADGFKIDFTGRTPSGKTLEHFGAPWGTALLHSYLKTIRDEAKRVKPDALVVTHTPNPYFGDVTDMVRLNDINTGAPVVEQMARRAQVAAAALPDTLIDTDNWPMKSLDEWKRYTKVQPFLGVPAVYFAGSIAGEKMQDSHWSRLRASLETYASGIVYTSQATG